MADTVTLKTIAGGVTGALTEIAKRGHKIDGWLNRVVYPMYQNYQTERWENEGWGWQALNPLYAQRKKVKYASFIGGGSKMMIATGTLVSSVIGPMKGSGLFGKGPGTKEHFKSVKNGFLTIGTSVDYAEFANDKRPFDDTLNDPEFIEEMQKSLREYLFGGSSG